MRKFIGYYNGFDMYEWSTGKYEAYKNGVPAGFWALDRDTLERKIDLYIEEYS